MTLNGFLLHGKYNILPEATSCQTKVPVPSVKCHSFNCGLGDPRDLKTVQATVIALGCSTEPDGVTWL